MTSLLVPKRATRGTVAITSCVPPYPCPQKKADSSPCAEVPRHQAPDSFIPVERAQRGDMRVDPKADSGEHAEADNCCKAP